MRTIPVVLVILLVAGAGTAFAAENSLPGDALYPVKLNVNERIQTALAVSAEGKAEAHSRFAERRLNEMEKLAIMGKFSEDLRARLEARFENHMERVQAIIVELENEGKNEQAVSLNARLLAMLEVHEAILARLSEQNGEEVSHVLEMVRSQHQHNAAVHGSLNQRIQMMGAPEVEVAAQNKKQAALLRIAEVEAFLGRLQATLDVEISVDAWAALELVRTLIAEGDAHMEDGAYGEAFMSFQNAHQEATKVKLMTKSQHQLNIRIPHKMENDASRDPKQLEADVDSSVEIDVEIQTPSGDLLPLPGI